ncbi:MAG: exodeoxyribonuclease VII large subunit [Rhizobiales bacterium]|nr:exodeoxyribonuclease VII large subunit [Hyphomicrobiales bacterium]
MSTVEDHDPETGEIRDTGKPNVGEYSVSELSHALKRTLEENFGHVRVRGEISGYRGPHTSGHCYFSIKDEGARLDAVIWRGSFGRLKSKLQEGLEVIATGRITSYPGKSSYQIIIENVEPAGVGALMALLEERKKKLAAEGLFDSSRKKPIPYLPRLIGVVTSPTGAVIRDILHRLNDRFPRHVLVWPVRVQGETSAAEVAAAIAGFNRMEPRPDVIIVARGGGSLEDLWSFNEEIVVRAAAASDIPLIAAVGHETDTTLIDFAADHRAPTPTAAAEQAVPVRSQLIDKVAGLSGRLKGGVWRSQEERRTRLRSAARALPKPDDILALARQRHDAAAGRLTQALRANTQIHRSRLERLAGRLTLRPMRQQVVRERERLDRLGQGAARAMALALDRRRHALVTQTKLFASLSYRSVLQRGFALVRDAGGQPVRAAAEVKPAQELAIEFADGRIKVRENGGPKQGSLF